MTEEFHTAYTLSLTDKQAEKLANHLARTGGAVDGRVAEEIRSQIPKPAVEEPQDFGSIVQAWHPSEDPSGTPDLWQRSPAHGKHYWENRNGVIEVWSDLVHPEVLRVGIGEQSDEWHRLDVANAQTGAYAEGHQKGSDEGWQRGWDALRAKLRRYLEEL
jgi:hypothetical protein